MSNTTVEEIEIIVTAKVEEALREFYKMKPQLTKLMKEVSEEISKVDFNKLNKTVKAGTDQVKKQIKSTFNPEKLDEGFLKATEKLYNESLKKAAQYTKSAKEELSKMDMQDVGQKVAQATKQISEAMNNTNIQQMAKDVGKAMKETKDKLEEVKDKNKSSEIELEVNNEEASQQITQLEKEIESLQKKLTSSKLKLEISQGAVNKVEDDVYGEIKSKNPNLDSKQLQNKTTLKLASDNNYNSLIQQTDKLNLEVDKYSSLLESAKGKLNELKQNTSQVAKEQEKANAKTSKLQAIFNAVGSGMKGAFRLIGSMSAGLGKIFQAGGKVVSIFKKFTPNLSGGMKSLLKYAATLFSLKSVYNSLSSAGQAWLSSQDSGAKQLSANIDYMKYALGSAVAPVIQYVTNLFYQLLKAVQSVIYALFKVNIFAKAGSSAYSSMANNANKASKANKSLASIHSEISNVSSSSGDSSNSVSSPNVDLSSLDTQLTPFQQRLADFFIPLVESWNTYSPQLISKAQETFSQIGLLLESIGQSFINIFANGTVYTILENILSIIGNIAEAFANAWNYNGNGDIIVQNLANALNNLLTAINNIVQSPGFQEWLNNCSDKFREITEKLAEIEWQPLIDALSEIGLSIGALALDVLSGLIDVFKWLVENPKIIEILTSLAIIIYTLSTAISVLTTAVSVAKIAFELFTSSTAWIVLGITMVIAAILLIIQNWELFKQKAEEIFTAVATFFKNVWTCIANVASSIWNGIITTISTIIIKIKEIISNVLNEIKVVWNSIWNFISSIVSNVWNGIWNTIKSVINSILGGIESMANGIVWGVNKVIDVLNNINVHIPDWIPIFGGKDIGFHINQMSTVSLPRLAKGNVAWKETIGVFGEYSGAQNDPEITSPRSIMYETFVKALKENTSGNDNPISLNITAIVGNKKIGQIAIEDIKDIKRATGEDLEVIFS